MKIVYAQLVKDLRLNLTLLLALWSLLALSFLLLLNNILSNSSSSNLLNALPMIAYAFTASIYVQDGSSDIHAFWRTLPISALQISIAKFALVFIFIVVPVVTVHWLSLQHLPLNLPKIQVVEPLAWFTMINLAIGLLGAVCGANRAKFIFFFVVGFWLLVALSFWVSSRYGIELPRYDGTTSIVILSSAIGFLLGAHWACYQRQGFKFQLSVVTIALLATGFASASSGAWFYTTYSPQPFKEIRVERLSSKQAKLYRYESHRFDETETSLIAKIHLPRHVQENFILRSQSQLNGAEMGRIYDGFNYGFDRGLFNLAHTKLGFATNDDRRFKEAELHLGSIEQIDWDKVARPSADIDIRVNFIEPQITMVADIPFGGGGEINFRDQIFNIGTKTFSNSRFVISVKGITRTDLMMGVVLYNPVLKEIVLTASYRVNESVATYLNRPKLQYLGTEWQASTRPMPNDVNRESSTGYTIISKSPSKEWLENARIKVYQTDLSVPVSRQLKFSSVNLSELPLAPPGFNY